MPFACCRRGAVSWFAQAPVAAPCASALLTYKLYDPIARSRNGVPPLAGTALSSVGPTGTPVECREELAQATVNSPGRNRHTVPLPSKESQQALSGRKVGRTSRPNYARASLELSWDDPTQCQQALGVILATLTAVEH
jgi:hypothetical protein